MSVRSALLRAAIGIEPLRPTEPTDWERWVKVASEQRVIPLFHALVDAGKLDVTAAQVERTLTMQIDVAALSVRLEQALLQVVGTLDAAKIPYAVLKGVATAHLDYPDPAQRQFGDVDLMVAPDDLIAARRVLEDNGWHQIVPLPKNHERFEHAITMGGRGVAEIDLHQRIAPRALGLRMPTGELLADREQFEIAGRRLWALSRTDRLIHASVHAVASRGQFRRLSSIADVLLISRSMSQLDVDLVSERAERWLVRPLVEEGVRSAHAEARLELPQAWSAAMAGRTLTRDRFLERAYLGDRRKLVAEELAHLRAMSQWTDRALYLYGHLHAGAGVASGGLPARLRYLRSRLRDPMESGPPD